MAIFCCLATLSPRGRGQTHGSSVSQGCGAEEEGEEEEQGEEGGLTYLTTSLSLYTG